MSLPQWNQQCPTPGSPKRPGLSRAAQLESLASDAYDVLVIGGGITGAGIALDATLRGLRVALIDKGDFASGTSSASSKLIHGGLRYLEHGEFALVREALRERHTLLRIAPHLVWPLRVVVPHYRSARRPRWLVKIGLSLYDWLAGRDRIGRHRWLEPAQVADAAPGIRADHLAGGFEFFDAQMDDARLCLEVILTAIDHGAAAANYVEAIEYHRDRSGTIHGCDAWDRQAARAVRIRARHVVNATGPWLDNLNRVDDGSSPDRLAPTKGVHVVLPSLGLGAGLLVTHPDDGRVLFVLPWFRRTLVGTTDTFFDGTPDDAAPLDDDVAYLLDATNHYFGNRFTRDDMIAAFAGLRPLLRANSAIPSAVSREYAIVRGKSGLWSIAGGKYTTYRAMAEELVDRIVATLGADARAAPSRTARQPLVGCPDVEWQAYRDRKTLELARTLPLDVETLRHLVDRYGSRTETVLEHIGESGARDAIVPGEPDIRAELAYQSAHELAVVPADHLLRRTRLGLFHPDLLPRGGARAETDFGLSSQPPHD